MLDFYKYGSNVCVRLKSLPLLGILSIGLGSQKVHLCLQKMFGCNMFTWVLLYLYSYILSEEQLI